MSKSLAFRLFGFVFVIFVIGSYVIVAQVAETNTVLIRRPARP